MWLKLVEINLQVDSTMLYFYAQLTLLWCSVYDCLLVVLCILCECVLVFSVSDYAFLNNYSCNL